MTPTGQLDQSAVNLYENLEQVATPLCSAYSDSLIQVDPVLYHVTGADLIAGQRYDLLTKSKSDRLYDELFDHLARLQREVDPRTTQHALKWSLAGVALLHTALVALFIPCSVEAYHRLCTWRRSIYHDEQLSDLGIRPPRPLLLHVTLAYYSELISDNDGLEMQVRLTNQTLKSREQFWELDVSSLQLHHFEDMNTFTAMGSKDRLVAL